MASKLDILNEKSGNFPALVSGNNVNIFDGTSRNLSVLSEKH